MSVTYSDGIKKTDDWLNFPGDSWMSMFTLYRILPAQNTRINLAFWDIMENDRQNKNCWNMAFKIEESLEGLIFAP